MILVIVMVTRVMMKSKFGTMEFYSMKKLEQLAFVKRPMHLYQNFLQKEINGDKGLEFELLAMPIEKGR